MQRRNGPEPVYKAIGGRIRRARVSRRIVQEQVATHTGLTRQSVANIEHGRQRFMVHTLIDIARALDIAPAELLPPDGYDEISVDFEGISTDARSFVLAVLKPGNAEK